MYVTPASRAAPEFEALFKTLFQEAHPEGMKVRRPKRLLTLRYKAASADFEVDLTQRIGPLPDISQTRAPVDALLRLAETACDALDKFSRNPHVGVVLSDPVAAQLQSTSASACATGWDNAHRRHTTRRARGFHVICAPHRICATLCRVKLSTVTLT